MKFFSAARAIPTPGGFAPWTPLLSAYLKQICCPPPPRRGGGSPRCWRDNFRPPAAVYAAAGAFQDDQPLSFFRKEKSLFSKRLKAGRPGRSLFSRAVRAKKRDELKTRRVSGVFGAKNLIFGTKNLKIDFSIFEKSKIPWQFCQKIYFLRKICRGKFFCAPIFTEQAPKIGGADFEKSVIFHIKVNEVSHFAPKARRTPPYGCKNAPLFKSEPPFLPP